MNEERFAATITDIRVRLGRGEYTDTERVMQGIAMRLLNDLDWPVFDTTVVVPGLEVGKRTVDCALIGQHAVPSVFVQIEGPRREMTEAFDARVPLSDRVAICAVTNGHQWAFYLSDARASDKPERFLGLDLRKASSEAAASIFRRFLGRESVERGEAVRKAAEARTAARRREREAREAERRRRRAVEHLPTAWAGLVRDGDRELVRILRARVESSCGVPPDADATIGFLKGLKPLGARPTPPRRSAAPVPKNRVEPAAARSVRRVGSGRCSFTWKGNTQRFRTSADLIAAIFTTFAKNDAGFCERFRRRRKGRTRAYVARSREDLFPGQPRLWKTNAKELPGGYFLGTHMGNPQKEQMIRWACQIVGIEFGRDLIVELPVAHRTKKRS